MSVRRPLVVVVPPCGAWRNGGRACICRNKSNRGMPTMASWCTSAPSGKLQKRKYIPERQNRKVNGMHVTCIYLILGYTAGFDLK